MNYALTRVMPALPDQDNLSSYLQRIWKIPLLTQEEEYEFATQYRQHGDLNAAHQLVTSHLRLVVKLAMGYKRYGLPMADLISEGTLGLMRAVQKFDPDLGFRLSTYSTFWIKACVTEYILRSWSLVKIGTMSAQKKLFFSLRKIKEKLNIFHQGDLTPDQVRSISEKLEIKEDVVVDMNRRLSSRDLSLNTPVKTDQGDMEYQDTLISSEPSPEAHLIDTDETTQRNRLLNEALEQLSEREREIISLRYLKETPETLDSLGQRFQISRERVRQIEARVIKKLESFMRPNLAE